MRGATSISDGIFSNERSENWEPPTWVLKKAQGARFVSNWSFGQIILERLSMTPQKMNHLLLLYIVKPRASPENISILAFTHSKPTFTRKLLIWWGTYKICQQQKLIDLISLFISQVFVGLNTIFNGSQP